MSAAQPDLLTGITPADAESVIALGVPQDLAAGEVLFRLGDHADALYLIQRGRIALSQPMRLAGHAQDVVVEEHDAGNTIGWSALVPPNRFTLTATALLPTRVIALPRLSLIEFCEVHPGLCSALALNIAAIIGHRLQVVQAMWLREMQRAVNNTHA